MSHNTERLNAALNRNQYKCPHCGAMHVDASRLPACLVDPLSRVDTQRIRDLEREVERLKPFEAKAERWFAEIEQRDADRADAERFRWLIAGLCGGPWTSLEIARSKIDADRAKEGV